MKNILRISLVCLIFLFLSSNMLLAQTRTSPFEPPEPNDTTFIVDDAPGLDTGCTFRSGGPLVFEIEVTRFVGEIDPDGTLQDSDTLINNKVISEKATLSFPAYDVDYDADVSQYGFNPERDVIKFNGVEIKRAGTNESFLMGENNTWIMNEFEVPIEIIKFPDKASPGNTPVPAINTISIDIDQANIGSDEYWCTAVDWAALSFKAMSPIVLIHGNNSNGGFFDRQGFTNTLLTRKIPFDNNSINMQTSAIRTNANRLATLIPNIVKSFGVDSVHLVAHSKGGLDSREYLANHQPRFNEQFKILSYTSLSTPHNGSVGADVLVTREMATREADDIEFVGFPTFTDTIARIMGVDAGTPDLTTGSTANFNNTNLSRLPKDIIFNTVAADADQNNSGTIDLVVEYQENLIESEGLDNLFEWSESAATSIENRIYQILRNTASVTLTYRTEKTFFGGTKRIATLTSVPTSTPLGNDTMVTVPSGHGIGSFATHTTYRTTFTGAQGRNHSSVANAGVATTVLPWIIQVEKTVGDLK